MNNVQPIPPHGSNRPYTRDRAIPSEAEDVQGHNANGRFIAPPDVEGQVSRVGALPHGDDTEGHSITGRLVVPSDAATAEVEGHRVDFRIAESSEQDGTKGNIRTRIVEDDDVTGHVLPGRTHPATTADGK